MPTSEARREGLPDRADQGAWVFVSHSHRDVHQVRRVRNELENLGHEPLLFFLKCLNDDSEVASLIKREIEQRQFFLFCNSANARASRWVQEELIHIRRHIQERPDKVMVELDLDAHRSDQTASMRTLSLRATASFAYAGASQTVIALAQEMVQALRSRDFRISEEIDLSPSSSIEANFYEPNQREYDRALREGHLLLLLSPEVFENPLIPETLRKVLDRANRSRKPARVIPVIAGDRAETMRLIEGQPLGNVLKRMKMIDFASGKMSAMMPGLLRALVT